MDTEMSEESFETIVYVQGVFSKRSDSSEFFNKVYELETSKCKVESNLCDHLSILGDYNYYLGKLRIAGIEDDVKRTTVSVKKVLKQFGLMELTEEDYEGLRQAYDSSGFDN